MDAAGLPALHDAIRHMHGCESTFVESVPITETFEGRTVWTGEVAVFDLVGHATARRAYAWSHDSGPNGRRRFVTVLGVSGVVDARTAVQAAAMTEYRERIAKS